MEISRNWRLRHQRYSLAGSRCECSAIYFPPRLVCPACRKRSMKPFPLSSKGEIVSFSPVTSPSLGFEDFVPYFVALIRLDCGTVIEAQLTDCDKPEIGMRVEMVIRKWREHGERGMIVYGYKFRPCVVAR